MIRGKTKNRDTYRRSVFIYMTCDPPLGHTALKRRGVFRRVQCDIVDHLCRGWCECVRANIRSVGVTRVRSNVSATTTSQAPPRTHLPPLLEALCRELFLEPLVPTVFVKRSYVRCTISLMVLLQLAWDWWHKASSGYQLLLHVTALSWLISRGVAINCGRGHRLDSFQWL